MIERNGRTYETVTKWGQVTVTDKVTVGGFEFMVPEKTNALSPVREDECKILADAIDILTEAYRNERRLLKQQEKALKRWRARK